MTLPYFSNYQLANPWWLLLLLVLPWLAWLRARRGHAPTLLFPTVSLIEDLGTSTRSRSGGFFVNLLHAGLACSIIAMARPQKVVTYNEVTTEGIAICVAVDVSLSMLIEDYYAGSSQINRLTAAKRVLVDFIKGRPNDRIGIVAFAGAPYTPCPPTLDHDWLLSHMDRIQTGIMEDGTAIGSGIAAAARRLDDQIVKSKVMVLITDGASNSGKLSPMDAAKLAISLKPSVRIYTIGVGTPGRHIIHMPGRLPFDSGRDEFDEKSLREIASIGDGKFFKAQDSATLQSVFSAINELEKSQVEKRVIIQKHDLFQIFLIIAASLVALHLVWKTTAARTAPVTV